MTKTLEIRFTHNFDEATKLKDFGYEPIECAFGQYGSVMGPYNMDHHGRESHREGVALRACRDHFGALAHDPRFVVTGTPDADAVIAIIALAGLTARENLEPAFYELVNAHDTDPIGMDLLASPQGEVLSAFNLTQGLTQSTEGFQSAIGRMLDLLEHGLESHEVDGIRRTDMARRRTALNDTINLRDRHGLMLPMPEVEIGAPVIRGDLALGHPGRVLVVKSAVWGFDQWYRVAPVVVSYASRMAKVTVGCPDVETAETLFGPGGLKNVWRSLGKGWGGRESIGGGPRGQRLPESAIHETADALIDLFEA